MPKGKLSVQEKYAIQGMLNAGNSLEDIQNLLDRPKSKAVENYVNGELKKIKETIAKIDAENADRKEKTKPKIEVPEVMYDRTCRRLIQDGLDKADATHLVNATIKDLNNSPKNENELYASAIHHRTQMAKDFLITRTQGQGREGVAIMTYPASSRADESGKRARAKAESRSSRGAIWQPKQGEMRGE
jgi:hypothetical protein